MVSVRGLIFIFYELSEYVINFVSTLFHIKWLFSKTRLRNYAETFKSHSSYNTVHKVFIQISRCKKYVFLVLTSSAIISKTRLSLSLCQVSWQSFIIVRFIAFQMTKMKYDIVLRRKSYNIYTTCNVIMSVECLDKETCSINTWQNTLRKSIIYI